MLRITTANKDSDIVTLQVEGRIVSDSIDTLERECKGLLVQGKSIDLDFCGVTFIDSQSVSVVKTLLIGKVNLGHCPGIIHSLFEEGAP